MATLVLKCFLVLFARFGINVKFVEGSNPAQFTKAIDENTKTIYVESIGNPKYNVAPVPELAEVPVDPVSPFSPS